MRSLSGNWTFHARSITQAVADQRPSPMKSPSSSYNPLSIFTAITLSRMPLTGRSLWVPDKRLEPECRFLGEGR